jgi:predicted nucleotidyltransferase
MKLPTHKQQLLHSITEELKHIDGVMAIVLGGSYATGRATENSDLDIGIYYSEQNPFAIEHIKAVAEKFAHNSQPTVTGFYEWGPWVNGGAWITTASGEVDFLYKNIEQITRTIGNAKNGIWENNFEQQPPYGFSSIIFLAETQSCLPLYDPTGAIKTLKESVEAYPQPLKQSVIQQSLWSAEFTIWQGEKFAAANDVYNTVGCFTRAVKNIVTALFALNEIYPLGDKRALHILEQAAIKPANLTHQINSILCGGQHQLAHNAIQLKHLFTETVALANGAYKPYYQL